MRNAYITFRSVTYAQRGEAVLRAALIRCSLQRAKGWMQERGCGYCLKLREQDLPRAMEALEHASVALGRVWVQEGEGIAREWHP